MPITNKQLTPNQWGNEHGLRDVCQLISGYCLLLQVPYERIEVIRQNESDIYRKTTGFLAVHKIMYRIVLINSKIQGKNRFLPFSLFFDEQQVSYDQLFSETGLFPYIYISEDIHFNEAAPDKPLNAKKKDIRNERIDSR